MATNVLSNGPFDDTFVTCAAFHPLRASAVVATRRPNAYISELNLAGTPCTTAGLPVFTTFTVTQLFIVVTDTGADRVVACLENRAVEIYSWNGGRALLYRHTPKSHTLKDMAVRYAMAELRGQTLFLVPLFRRDSKGRGVEDGTLPDTKLYHACCDPEAALAGPEGKQMLTTPSSRFYYLDCFKSNGKDKHLPSVDAGVPIVGLRVHPSAPLLAVLCRDGGLRLYDLDGDAKGGGGAPTLYNVAPLSAVMSDLQLPTFSKIGLNGDGRSKAFDFVPGMTERQSMVYGKKSNKSRRIYSNINVAIVEARRLVVVDLTVPGACDEVFSISAPPKTEFHGVLCDPIGNSRSSGISTTSEERIPNAGFAQGHGSRRIIWALTSNGQLAPYTLDDSLCTHTKLLATVDWIKPIPVVGADRGGPQAFVPGGTVAPVAANARAASESPARGARAATGGAASTGATSTSRALPYADGDGHLCQQWVCAQPSTHVGSDITNLAKSSTGMLLRMQVAMHPTMPLVLGVVPVEGSFIVRRATTSFQDQHHLCTAGSVASVGHMPAAALSAHVLLHRNATTMALSTAPNVTFMADSRSGLSVIRLVAVDRTLSLPKRDPTHGVVSPPQPSDEATDFDVVVTPAVRSSPRAPRRCRSLSSCLRRRVRSRSRRSRQSRCATSALTRPSRGTPQRSPRSHGTGSSCLNTAWPPTSAR
jgi:hypothetical protein